MTIAFDKMKLWMNLLEGDFSEKVGLKSNLETRMETTESWQQIQLELSKRSAK